MSTRRKKTVKSRLVKRRKKASKKRTSKSPSRAKTSFNRNAYWKAYKQLQEKADKAWEKLREDVRKKARADILVRDHNHLKLLIAECDYMIRECMRISRKSKNRRRR